MHGTVATWSLTPPGGDGIAEVTLCNSGCVRRWRGQPATKSLGLMVGERALAGLVGCCSETGNVNHHPRNFARF